jgi:hypothetical protein
VTCDGLELTATGLQLELTSNAPELAIGAGVPSLTLEAGDCGLTLTIDSTLAFDITTHTLELATQTLEVCFATPIPMSTGEANTASNCGDPEGVGIFNQKQGVNLEFRNLRSITDAIFLAVNPVDCTIDIDFDESANVRYNVEPVGDKDGLNIDYALPDTVVPSLFRLYRNGVRQMEDTLGTCDFRLSESGGVGTGYDTVEITTPALLSWEQLTADYVIAS